MNHLITLLLLACSLTTFAQTDLGYKVHTCKSGHCAVIEFPDTTPTINKSTVLAEWNEPIRISVGVQEGVTLAMSDIEAAIAEDSQIAIEDGLYTGDDAAYILANVFSFSPDELLDCLLYTSPSPRDRTRSRMPSSA